MNRIDSFKEWVAEEYQRRGWSMNELARRIGYSSGGVSKALAPGGDITWDFAAALADAFGMSAVEVFRKAGLLPVRTETAERVAEVVSRLRDTDQRVMLRIAQGLAQAPAEVEPEQLRMVAVEEPAYPIGDDEAVDIADAAINQMIIDEMIGFLETRGLREEFEQEYQRLVTQQEQQASERDRTAAQQAAPG